MQRSLIAALLLVAFVPNWSGFADDKKEDQPDEKHPSMWMKRKLNYAQNILAGLTSADFDQVKQSAKQMQGLSKIEGFVRGRTPGYKSQLQVFQEATDEIIRQADRESVEGATLAFTQLTITCVNCHKQLRELAEKK